MNFRLIEKQLAVNWWFNESGATYKSQQVAAVNINTH